MVNRTIFQQRVRVKISLYSPISKVLGHLERCGPCVKTVEIPLGMTTRKAVRFTWINSFSSLVSTSTSDFPFSCLFYIPRRDRMLELRRKKEASDLLWFLPIYLVSLLIHIHATYSHNPHYYTLGINLENPRLPSLPIRAHLPRRAVERADEGRSRALVQHGGERQQGRRWAPVNHRGDHQRSAEENAT